ncbi:putative peptidase S10, serine carboxypeptidase, alpha/Beta hydrolase [Dioscorea sansibarensis]
MTSCMLRVVSSLKGHAMPKDSRKMREFKYAKIKSSNKNLFSRNWRSRLPSLLSTFYQICWCGSEGNLLAHRWPWLLCFLCPFFWKWIVKYNGSLPTLVYHPFSWTKVSNMIFLDSPAGSGLSFSNTPETYVDGDVTSSLRVHKFLRKWFIDHPKFLSNPLWLVVIHMLAMLFHSSIT